LSFLIGTWEAKTTSGSAGASVTGAYTFQLELSGHVLARHSSGSNCAGPSDFNCEHKDLLYIFSDPPNQPLKAIYFDNEGHVIHYDVSLPVPNKAVFESSGPRPRFRLVYELKGETMEGKFQASMPGSSEFALRCSGGLQEVGEYG
jgi:hypothetical protein